jgi:hypothetical protein
VNPDPDRRIDPRLFSIYEDRRTFYIQQGAQSTMQIGDGNVSIGGNASGPINTGARGSQRLGDSPKPKSFWRSALLKALALGMFLAGAVAAVARFAETDAGQQWAKYLLPSSDTPEAHTAELPVKKTPPAP